MSRYSEATRKSLEWADESLIHYELIESVLCAIMDAKAQAGSHAHGHPHHRTHSHSPHSRLLSSLLPDCPPHLSTSSRGVLVFLPGMAEIRRLQMHLLGSRACWQAAGGSGRLVVLPLHGSLGAEEQQRVFASVGEGVWKVVLATNIAETSVTIDDIV